MRTIQIGRTIQVVEKRLEKEEVADFINRLEHDDIVLAPCPCRTEEEMAGDRKCREKNPVGACIFLGVSAVHIEERGFGKRVSKKAAVEYVDRMTSMGLYATVDNELSDNSVICLCCGCCCSHLSFNYSRNESTSPFRKLFVPRAGENCLFCGKCANVCLFSAINVDTKNKTHHITDEKCSGCGFCIFACPTDSLETVNIKQNGEDE